MIKDLFDFNKLSIQNQIDNLTYYLSNLDLNFSSAIFFFKEYLEKNMGKVVVIGIGKSGHIGRKFSASLSSTGTASFFLSAAESGHGDLGAISKKDLIVIISQSGSSDEVIKILPYLRELNVPIVSLTSNLNSILAKSSKYVFDTTIIKEVCPLGLAPMSTTTLALVICDTITAGLMKLNNFKKDDFSIRHPFGSLGRRLSLKVSDVFVGLDNTPHVYINCNLSDALIEMSNKGFGILFILNLDNSVHSIFTDGDLRRLLNLKIPDFSELIANYGNTNFIFANVEEKLDCIIERLKSNKVNAIPVIDHFNKIKGVLSLRLLFQSGVL